MLYLIIYQRSIIGQLVAINFQIQIQIGRVLDRRLPRPPAEVAVDSPR